MTFVSVAIHFLPYWALPLALFFLETARVFKRRGRKGLMIQFVMLSIICFALTVCFFVFKWGQQGYSPL
jgi:hypothetical protein